LPLRLYNSLGRKVSEFRPIREGEVRMYTCGPTVWNYAHIGNFRTFVAEDILRRYLRFKGYKVIQAKNLTDVEDRIIEGIKKTGKSLRELTDFYARAFMEDLDALNIQRAEEYPRATQHIPEMEAMIRSLLSSGHAYRADDGSTYYSIRTFARYGELSGIKVEDLKEGARVSADHYEKTGAHDFALWKSWDESDGEVYWESDLGKGRPGWHIECSAMAIKYLGESFDIHTGGKDLRFPHHENEIAQSEAVTGKTFARYWVHSEFLRINGEEMHKSLGNMVTFRQLAERGWKARAIRLFLISAHYRDELNLTDESLQQATTNVSRLDSFSARLRDAAVSEEGEVGVAEARAFLEEFERSMDEDLNVPEALASLYGLQRTVNTLIDSRTLSRSGREAVLQALERADSVLGVMTPEKTGPISARVEELIREREKARRERDYSRADAIRSQLKAEGITIEDKPGGGTSWKMD
jgi:cysteinyl-tRNA synthetase